MKSEEDIAAWLTGYLVKELGVEHVPADADFADLGLGSRQAIVLAGDLEDWLGRELDAAIMWDHPTIAALSRHLAGG
jgi:acyl carrier protein